MQTLILGIGSPFADDQLGWLVTEGLGKALPIQNQIKQNKLQIANADRPGLNLLNWLQQPFDKVILIDMVKTNLSEPGNLYHLNAKQIIGFSGMLSSHSLGVSSSLALAEVLGIKIDHVEFWGVEGINFGFDELISEPVTFAIPKVIKEIINILIVN